MVLKLFISFLIFLPVALPTLYSTSDPHLFYEIEDCSDCYPEEPDGYHDFSAQPFQSPSPPFPNYWIPTKRGRNRLKQKSQTDIEIDADLMKELEQLIQDDEQDALSQDSVEISSELLYDSPLAKGKKKTPSYGFLKPKELIENPSRAAQTIPPQQIFILNVPKPAGLKGDVGSYGDFEYDEEKKKKEKKKKKKKKKKKGKKKEGWGWPPPPPPPNRKMDLIMRLMKMHGHAEQALMEVKGMFGNILPVRVEKIVWQKGKGGGNKMSSESGGGWGEKKKKPKKKGWGEEKPKKKGWGEEDRRRDLRGNDFARRRLIEMNRNDEEVGIPLFWSDSYDY